MQTKSGLKCLTYITWKQRYAIDTEWFSCIQIIQGGQREKKLLNVEKHAHTPSQSCKDSSHSEKGPGHASCWNVTPHTHKCAYMSVRTHSHAWTHSIKYGCNGGTFKSSSFNLNSGVFPAGYTFYKDNAFEHSICKCTGMCTYSHTCKWLTRHAYNLQTSVIILIHDIHNIKGVCVGFGSTRLWGFSVIHKLACMESKDINLLMWCNLPTVQQRCTAGASKPQESCTFALEITKTSTQQSKQLRVKFHLSTLNNSCFRSLTIFHSNASRQADVPAQRKCLRLPGHTAVAF